METAREDVLKTLLDTPDLPTLPDVVVRLYATIDDVDSSADDLTTILSSDSSMTSRLLRLANSAFFHTRFPIESVRQAVVVIGFEGVRSLALATSVIDMFGRKNQPVFNPRDFWLHSLGAARAAELLVEASRRCTYPEAAFTAGLLHDIGRFALALSCTPGYQSAVEMARDGAMPLPDAERAVLGISGAEAGAWMLKTWKLPDTIRRAVAFQHAPWAYEGPGQADVAAVSLASSFSRLAAYGEGGESDTPTLSGDALETIGIDEVTAQRILETLERQREEAAEMLEMMRC